jgi:hypothetical protein
MPKTSVLYILRSYPQISQTYIKAEIEALQDEYDLTIVARRRPNLGYENHLPYRCLADDGPIDEIIEEVRPDVIHTHFLTQARLVGPLASRAGIPYTVRTHSFDTIPLRAKPPGRVRSLLSRDKAVRRIARLRKNVAWLNHELCLGVLAFPFVRPYLEAHGVRPEKIVDCHPVVNHRLFDDRSPNGDAIMNLGAAISKKKMEDFIGLAARVPEKRFNLYALGYDVLALKAVNDASGNPLRIIPPVDPDQMLGEYKRHQWLVYTADAELGTVGWPMAVAEAQAAGVGVCFPNIRPDLADYVGPGGILYDSIDEVIDLIQRPVPNDLREAGFVQARESDIQAHKHLLTALWPKPSLSTVGSVGSAGSRATS